MAILNERFDEALVYAADLHRDQVRKGSDAPYISHLLGAASIAIELGADEDQAIAALLHDAVEDQGGKATLDAIRDRFGAHVASIVDACSDSEEEPKPPWRERKEAYLRSLDDKPADALLVSLADKTHNARAILDDLATAGRSVWERFTAGREGSLWYYEALAESFERLLPGEGAARLRRTVDAIIALDRSIAAP